MFSSLAGMPFINNLSVVAEGGALAYGMVEEATFATDLRFALV
jgi:hypothetical protein